MSAPRPRRPRRDRKAKPPENPPSPEQVMAGLTTIITDNMVNGAVGVCGIPAERMSATEAGRRKCLPIRQRILRALEHLGPLTPERLRQVVNDDLIESYHASPVELTEHYNIVATATRFASRVNSGIYMGVMLFDGSPAEVFYTGGPGMANACGIRRRPDCRPLQVLKVMRSEAAGRTTAGAAARALGVATHARRSDMRYTLRSSLMKRGLVRQMEPAERRSVPSREWREGLAPVRNSHRIETAVFQLTDLGREVLAHADWLTEHGADTGNIRSLLASLGYYRRLKGKNLENQRNRADSEPTTEPRRRPTKPAPERAVQTPAQRNAEYHRQWRAKRREAKKDDEMKRKAIDLALAERRLRLIEEKKRAAEQRRAKREAREQARLEALARNPPEQEFD